MKHEQEPDFAQGLCLSLTSCSSTSHHVGLHTKEASQLHHNLDLKFTEVQVTREGKI